MTNQQLTTPPDWRGLCEKLVDITTAHANPDDYAVGDVAATLTRARAALAQPEPEVVGPSDEELLSLDQLRDAWNAQADAMNSWTELGVDEIVWWAQHQAIARYGRPAPAPAGEVGELVRQLGSMAADAEAADWVCDAAVLDLAIKHLEQLNPSQPVPPAEGEVADLAEFLRIYGDHVLDEYGDLGEHDMLTRAADLLERQAAPVPVAVSERLPQPEDCDAEGRCWWYRYTPTPEWHLRFGRTGQHNHWLSFNALPIPSGDVES